jgi:hypothetical protein
VWLVGLATGLEPSGEAGSGWGAALLGGVAGAIAPACFLVIVCLAALMLSVVVPSLGAIRVLGALLLAPYWPYVLVGGFVAGGPGGWLGPIHAFRFALITLGRQRTPNRSSQLYPESRVLRWVTDASPATHRHGGNP